MAVSCHWLGNEQDACVRLQLVFEVGSSQVAQNRHASRTLGTFSWIFADPCIPSFGSPKKRVVRCASFPLVGSTWEGECEQRTAL
jgi:hypothetical protein